MSETNWPIIEDPWDLLPDEARQDWLVHENVCQASQDPKVLATFELFASHEFSRGTKEYILDDLEQLATREYGVPLEYVPQVFSKAEAQIWREIEANGQA